MNSILIWLVAALLGVGSAPGDASTSAESAVPPPTEPLRASVEPSSAVEQRFAEREMLPPCGMVDVSRHAPGTTGTRLSPPAKAWRCLHDAVGVGGAELVTLDLRPNGSTLHTFYRATREGRLEIWTQRTRNASGRVSSRWAYEECQPSEDLRRQPCAS